MSEAQEAKARRIIQGSAAVLVTAGGFGAAAPQMGEAKSDLHERASRADVYNSPGWKRLQNRSQGRGLSEPAEARNIVIDLSAVAAFTVGDRVFHQKFGYGSVTGVEGDKLDIAVDKAGEKKVVAKFGAAAESAGDVPF